MFKDVVNSQSILETISCNLQKFENLVFLPDTICGRNNTAAVNSYEVVKNSNSSDNRFCNKPNLMVCS